MSTPRSLEATIDRQVEALCIAEKAGKLAATMFNVPGGHVKMPDIKEQYDSLILEMSGLPLDEETRRGVWERYANVFVQNSMTCAPSYPIV